MKFKKVYIEITNSCNFDCSFCFKTARSTRFMSPDEFRVIVTKIRPFTDYVYLHVLGEPLLHPGFEEILSIAGDVNLNVNITTNGGLIARKKEILLRQAVRQVNISLHDAEENIQSEKWGDYLDSIFDYVLVAAGKTYINLRLWNSGVETSSGFNCFCLEKIALKFDKNIEELYLKGKDTGIKLANHIFLQHAPRFEWPDGERTRSENARTCYALRDQIAILVDGTVVPCCLDADGAMTLGNIFEHDLNLIFNSERAQKIRNGFLNSQITEPFCRTCGFFVN
ncbi:MAG: SPASM domain-containing protein [Bacteroidales bacterium]|nr:SPASM domain-containing protein [Bacteroidales bacterium]